MELNYTILFRIINIVAAGFMIAGGILTCTAGGFPNVIQGIFVILFGIMTILFEFRLPRIIAQHASFMFSFLGRAIFYFFVGCITLNYGAIGIAFGVIIIVIGVFFAGICFTSLEAPSNMRMSTFEETLQGISKTDPITTTENVGTV
ncbi:COPI associated [Backusella circina FSU 941]|nr:COPI associated [Backusella circina FSU 941]